MADNTGKEPGSDPGPRRNVVLIVVDQQHAQLAGYAGHPDVFTPSLDRLAESGTTFASAYTSSPVGSAARATLASGRYRRSRDSATGARRSPGWGNALTEAGYRVTAVGDLHVAATSDYGFGDQRLSVRGERAGVVRGNVASGEGSPARDAAIDIGPGESPYSRFDRAVTAAAVGFLHEEARSEPWALMVSLAAPHLPRAVPREFFERYDAPDVRAAPSLPAGWADDDLKRGCDIGRPFTDEEQARAYQASLALCSFLDAKVGQLLDAVEQSGQAGNTLVIYTAGHGGSPGLHGSWCRNPLGEDAVRVPLLVAGAGIAPGRRVDTPVSHVDIAPTILDWAGVTPRHRPDGSGESLLDTARSAPVDRAVLAAYSGESGQSVMVRTGHMKYVERAGRSPLLFDLAADPHECVDLAGEPGSEPALVKHAGRLRTLWAPDDGVHGSRAALVG